MILSLRQRYGFYAINSQHVPWTQERYQSVRCLSKAISSARFTYCGAQFLVLARRREAVERSYVPSTACFVMCMGPTCAITKHRIDTAGASDQAFGTSPKPSTSHHVIATQKTESARLKSSIEGGTVLPLSFCAPLWLPSLVQWLHQWSAVALRLWPRLDGVIQFAVECPKFAFPQTYTGSCIWLRSRSPVRATGWPLRRCGQSGHPDSVRPQPSGAGCCSSR
jgi:hypothetical protein